MAKKSKIGDVPPAPPRDTAGTIAPLKALIVELLPEGRPTIKRVAPRLGMSIRTLQRRLRDLGHSFEDIVDDTRREAAIDYLTIRSTGITQTALLLGYSDMSHFTRAFRRWTRMTPREFVRNGKSRPQMRVT